MNTSSDRYQLLKREKIKLIDWLIENFPAAFFKKARNVKPLKVGILDDILDFYRGLSKPPFSKRLLRTALAYYCSSPAYLSAQKNGAARVDLYGNEIEVVTAEHAKYARQQYKRQYLSPAKKISTPADEAHSIDAQPEDNSSTNQLETN